MDKFAKKVSAIRSGLAGKAKAAAKAAGSRKDAVLEAETSRNRKMIEQNFGSEKAYADIANPDLPGTLGQAIAKLYMKARAKQAAR